MTATNRPFDAVDCCIAETPDIIVVPVYWTSGGKDQSVTRETRDLQEHHLFPHTAVHLQKQSSVVRWIVLIN